MRRVNKGVRHGRSLRAEVRGSQTYAVEINVAEDGIHAACSCPYNYAGYCKHIGAVLLLWLESPGSFTVEQSAPAATQSVIDTIAIEPPATAVPAQPPFWLTTPFAMRQQQDTQNLYTWLDASYVVPDLRQLAKEQGWTINGTRKANIIQQIIQQITQPDIALKSLRSLDSEHRQVLDAMAVLHPALPYRIEHLTAVAQQWGPLTTYKTTDVYVQHLYRKGLAIRGSVVQTYPPQNSFIPKSVHRALPPLLANRVSEMSLPEHTDSRYQLGQPGLFLQRFQQILLLLDQNSPPLRPPMPRPHLEKFHEFLREWDYVPEEIKQAQQANKLKAPDPKQSFTVPPPQPALPDETIVRLAPLAGDEAQLNFIYHLLLAAGLLQPGSPVTVWRKVKEQFFQQDEATQWAILARTYFSTIMPWSEMWLALAERPSLQLKRTQRLYYRTTKPQELYGILTFFRAQALHLLAGLPDDRWLNLREVTDLLHPVWTRFDAWSFTTTQYSGDIRPEWFLADNGRLLDTTANKADWDIAQGAFIRHVIQGPLHWLGLADISMENGQLVAFRLHGLSDLFFDKVEAIPLAGTAGGPTTTAVSPPPPTDAVTIAGNAIFITPTAVGAQTHSYLDKLAQLEEAAPTRFTYRLSTAAVHEAFESGQTLDQLIIGWQQCLPIAMPDAIRQQLIAWWNAYGQVRLYEHVTVIEFGDEYALAEMKAATSLEKHLVAEISPTMVIIHANAIDTLVAELEKAGYTPKKSDKIE